ncbi:MAG: hypothetical protein AAF432_03735 [Planctomycetota bacterium]
MSQSLGAIALLALGSSAFGQCPGDCAPANPDGTFGNGVVNVDDLIEVVAAFGSANGPADVAPTPCGNNTVNVDDMVFVITAFGDCPPFDNDFCDQPQALFIDFPLMVGDNILATDDNALNCETSLDGLSDGSAPSQSSGGRWYCVLGNGNELTLSTCGDNSMFGFTFYQTFINVYCGDCVDPVCVGDSADTITCGLGPFASMSWCAEEGVSYRVLIHGLQNDIGEEYIMEVMDTGMPCETPISCGAS